MAKCTEENTYEGYSNDTTGCESNTSTLMQSVWKHIKIVISEPHVTSIITVLLPNLVHAA